MTEEQTTPDPNKGQSDQPTVPAAAGQAGQTTQPQADDLPEKFKGKSATDIAKSYLELERKLGENSKETETYRKQNEQWMALGQVIQSDPNLKKAVEDRIAIIAGKKTEQPKVDDVRVATTDKIVEDFEKSSGIANLDPEEKKKIQQKIGAEVESMRGKWESIPLNELPTVLKKAYRLVKGDLSDTEKAKLEAIIEVNQNREAGMGNMNSSSVNRKVNELTEQQKEVARKMHISESDYLKNLKELEES